MTNNYKSVSFTGHRPNKIKGWKTLPTTIEGGLRTLLREVIIKASQRGTEVFNSGAAPGIDLWAADEVLRLREVAIINPATRLNLYLPYLQFAESFLPAERQLFDSIVARMKDGDKVISLSDHYHHGCYNQRNDRLAEDCDLMIAYYEGSTGGTRYTIRRARSLGREVINLCQAELFD